MVVKCTNRLVGCAAQIISRTLKWFIVSALRNHTRKLGKKWSHLLTPEPLLRKLIFVLLTLFFALSQFVSQRKREWQVDPKIGIRMCVVRPQSKNAWTSFWQPDCILLNRIVALWPDSFIIQMLVVFYLAVRMHI